MIRLTSGRLLACEIEPQLGGCIRGLWLDGEPVLRSTHEPLASARQSGSYPLVPFSNRIARASLQWAGTSHPLVSNNAPEPHAIHGVGWQRPWTVLESEDDFVMLAYEHRADASWPFAFDSSQTLRVRGNALELTLALTNQSNQAAPVGLGWHPFFVKRPGSHVRFEAGGRWDMGADKLPTTRRAASGIDAGTATLDVDHCFDGWTGDVELRDGVLRTRIRSNLRRLVVFTNPTRDTIAIEPVSHVNNATTLVAAGASADDLGLRTLQPGESMTAEMSIDVERAT